MPVKSFFWEIEKGARHFYATALRGEVSDANVRGYLRAASQIEDLWQEIDNRVAVLIGQGIAPGGVFIACVSTAVSHTIELLCLS